MSKIEWTDQTWNPVTGCSRVSEGCTNCYAMRQARRFDGMGHGYDRTTRNKDGVDWTGQINLHPDRLGEPLRWQKPRRVFVCSMGDLFHPGVPDAFIVRVFRVMSNAKRHTFQVLTKRPARMAHFLARFKRCDVLGDGSGQMRGWDGVADLDRRSEDDSEKYYSDSQLYSPLCWEENWPLENVWLGTSCEDQETADERIPHLLRCPAAVRFVSAEPLLGPMDLHEWFWSVEDVSLDPYRSQTAEVPRGQLHWIIAGGESGHGARPMHPLWVKVLRNQCREADTAFFFKQHGSFAPCEDPTEADCAVNVHSGRAIPVADDANPDHYPSWQLVKRVGKKAAGRELDGDTYDEMPDPAEVAA